VLLHLVDGTSETVAQDYQTIITELEAYAEALGDKPRITALTKIDALDDETLEARFAELAGVVDGEVFKISGVSNQGLPDVLRRLYQQILDGRVVVTDEAPWQP